MGAIMSSEFDDFEGNEHLEQEDEFAGLSPEQYEKLMEELENFNNSFLSYLAGTANYEVCPTTGPDGRPLTKEHYQLIKKECAKTGAKILYSYEIGNTTVVVNTGNMKTLVIKEGEAH